MSIQIKNLSFSYGSRSVLNNISFEATSGDCLSILGPNGVGKSTLFRCMLGLQNGYTGEIFIDGCNLNSYTPTEFAKTIAYIPQSSMPVFNHTVLDAVMMGMTSQLKAFSSPGKAHEKKALEALERFGIAHLAQRGCTQISGGERQLMLIARAVVQEARILIMDEPTASLDYGNQVRVMEEIKNLTTEGYTVILSTHNPEQALLYTNKMLILLNGKVLHAGTPKETLTEKILKEVYHVRAHMETLTINGESIEVCVPLGKL